MKRKLLTLTLAVLTIGLLGSCSKINERIDGLDKRVNDLENDKIASVQQQIDGITNSIACLETIRTNIQSLMEAMTIHGQDIADLKTADQTIEGKINNLKDFVDTELAKYATTEWANATFATLTKQAEIITDLSNMETNLTGLDEKLNQSIADLDSSLKSWVNEQLSAYYKKAEMDTELKLFQDEIDSLKADGETNKTKLGELETSLATLTNDLENVKDDIETKYTEAISQAINEYDGTITQTIQTKINDVNKTITALTKRVASLETSIGILTGRVDAIENMIQSVVFVPTYSDGNATYSYKDTTLLKFDFMVSPASVAETLVPEDASILVNTLLTRAGSIDCSFDVSEIVEKDAANGIYTFVSTVSYDFIPTILEGSVSVSLKIEKGNTNICSDFVKVVAETPKIENLTDLFEKQYFESQGWNGEGTIRLYYGCYPGMDSHKYLTGWTNTMNGSYRETSDSMYDSRPWIIYYNAVREANLILNYVENVFPNSEKNRYLKAQALTFRAYCFFQLSQLYCYRWKDSDNGNSRGIILRTNELGVTKDYFGNNLESQFEGMFGEQTDHAASTLKETYDQIFGDLDEAITIFNQSSITRSPEKNYEPNADVAHAVYAHAAISKEDWALASEHAVKARENYEIMTNEEYKAGFSTVNREWIWSTPGYNELYYYSYLAYVASNSTASQVRSYPLMISKQLIDQIPATDIRRGLYYIPQNGDQYNQNTGKVTATTYVEKIFNDYAFGFPENHTTFTPYTYMQFKIRLADPDKQNPGRGPICLFRAADMYYLEAESQYHLGNEARAQEILVQLTEPRDPSYTECTKTGEALLNEIKLYRRFDCWAEGFDWFDCKRWGGDYKRLGYREGGNFFDLIKGDFPSDIYNKWTWVYPDVETSQNSLVTTYE